MIICNSTYGERQEHSEKSSLDFGLGRDSLIGKNSYVRPLCWQFSLASSLEKLGQKEAEFTFFYSVTDQ